MGIDGVGSSPIRFTGMASGLDTETIVKQMLALDKAKIDKQDKNRQTIMWKQEAYREIIDDLNSLKSTYFDVLSDDYMLSSNALSSFDVNYSKEDVVKVSAISGVVEGDYTVEVVKLAQKAKVEGSKLAGTPSNSTKLSDLGCESINPITLKFTINGQDKTMSLDNSGGDKTISDLNQAIEDATDGQVTSRISELTGKVTFETSETGSSTTLAIEETSSTSLLSSIGITGVGIRTVNQVSGVDAEVNITPPGSAVSTSVTKSANKFTIDNVNYELLKEGETSVVTISPNVDKTFDKVKGFIDKYNELIGKISSKLEEKKEYSFEPLTDEEKEAMSDEEIEKWESKAKQGILRNDGVLERMLSSFRTAFFDSVDGAGINFSKNDLGLDTSEDVGQRGKIIIKDAEKFKEVLANNGEQVMRLFTKSADISYSRNLSDADRKTRYNDSGIFQRLRDIVEDNISTFRDANGNKGVLLEKAGIKEDASFINNMLTKQIEAKDKLIKELTTKMYQKEERLYQQFAKLETSMNNLNSQSSWLASQLGGV